MYRLRAAVIRWFKGVPIPRSRPIVHDILRRVRSDVHGPQIHPSYYRQDLLDAADEIEYLRNRIFEGQHMLPLRIKDANRVMTAPDSHPDVRPLHVRFVDGCSVSRWEPTMAEVQIIVEGGSVELWIIGQQPAVAIKAVPHE